jgi:hypothetical protein
MPVFQGSSAAPREREEKEFRITITHRDAIVVRMRFKREDRKKRIGDFAIVYEAEIEGTWYEVIRYDTAHGYPEVHKLWRSEKGIRLPDEGIPYHDLLVKYRNDIRDNHRRYRELMEKALRRRAGSRKG